MKVLQKSIEGINREIDRRETRLRQRKAWYYGTLDHSSSFTWRGFYVDGYRIMQEIKRLKIIRCELAELIGVW